MGDVQENVDITVEGGDALARAAAEAKELASALHEDRDAAAELGASSGEVEGLAAELGHARDNALELAAAQDAAKSKAGGIAGGAFRGIADELGLTADELTRKLPMISAIGEEAHARLNDAAGDIERIGQASGDSAEKQAADLEKLLGLSRDIQSTHLAGAETASAAPANLERYAASLENLKRDLADAEPRIDAMNSAIDDSGRTAGIASVAMQNFHDIAGDRSSATSWESIVAAPKEMSGALDDFGRSSDKAVHDLEGLLGGGEGGGGKGLIRTLFGDASDAAGNLFTVLKSGAGQAGEGFSSLQSLGMPALFTGLGAAISTIGPVLLSSGAGFGSFAAMAYPALRQVEQGVTNVTAAQKAYQQAQAVYAADPTKANLTAQKTALAQLQATYSTMPPEIRKSVMAIQDLGHAWSEAGKKSGIQQDALKDIPKAIGDIKGLIPSITGLAKATAPVISGMLGDFGKFEKSAGFKQFISNVTGQIGPASKALGSFGNAFGSLVTDLTSKSNMAAGDKLLTSLSGLMKSSGPGAVSGLGKVAGGISAISRALSTAEKEKSGPNESSLNMVLGAGEWLGRGIGDSAKGWSEMLNNVVKYGQAHGNSQMNAWMKRNMGFSFPGQGVVPDASKLTGSIQNAGAQLEKRYANLSKQAGAANAGNAARDAAALRAAQKAAADQPKLDSPQRAADAAKGQLQELHAAARKASSEKVKISVKADGASKAKSDLDGINKAAKKAGTTKADIKVKADGADKAKSDLKDIGDAAKKAGHSKVDVKVQVTGLGQAKSQIDSLRADASRPLPQPHITISMTGAQSATTQLTQVGTAAGLMASGVTSGASQAESAARVMAGQMKGSVAGIPAAFHAAGASAGSGMAAGIEASTGAAVAAARSMASQVENAAKVELQTKSPSKKFKKIGQDTILGYILGLEGGKSAVQAAMNAAMSSVPFKDATITKTISELRTKLQSMAGGAGWDNPLRASQASGLTKMLDADNKKLMALAKQRQQLLNQIQAADALAKSVEAAAISGASLTSVAGNTIAAQQQTDLAAGAPGTSQNPYQNIQAGLKDQLGQIRTFRADIIKLKKEGLDKRGIQQILAAGVSGGLPVAQQILAEGSGGVKAIAKLDDEIGLASKKLGITGANAAYESASQIGKALAQGLKDSLKTVDTAMGDIAKTLVTSIMTALGASSKDIRAAIQKLDKELGLGGPGSGGGTGKGKGNGGAHPGPIIERKPGAHPGPIIYRPPPMQMHPDARPAGGGGGSEPAAVLHATINVTVDGKQLARTTETYTLRRAKRRPQTYPELPGRT